MPELPEVETVRRGLAPVLLGARFSRVETRRADLRFAFPAGFSRRLGGVRVTGLDRRGKYILAGLDSGETLIVHLGMTGRFEIEGLSPAAGDDPAGGEDATGAGSAVADAAFALAAPALERHAHVLFFTEAGARITFFDARRFGFMDLAATDALDEHPRLAAMGPEPLGEAFTPAFLARALAGRAAPIKALLLDQRLVAGLGNIYVCEALFRARISPTVPGCALGRPALMRLVAAVRRVLGEAIEAGGSTLRDYAGPDRALGYFQHRFTVYGRAGEGCVRRGCGGTIARLVQSGRSTFHCPKCQG